MLKSELDRLGQRHGDDAVLEREAGVIDRVVLDVQLGHAQRPGQAVGADQRRAADVQADGRLAVDRQELAVTPHRLRAGAAIACAAHRPGHGVVVVGDFQRPEVVGTEVQGFLGIELAAKPALQTGHQFSQTPA